MKRWISLLSVALLAGLTVFARGQWQAQPQIDPRVGPIYPVNPAYNFYSTQSTNPYQFNWASGRWDYVPFPDGGSSAGFPAEPAPAPARPYSNLPNGSAYGPAHTVPPVSPSDNPPNNSSPPQPDDTGLWSGPATRPDKTVAPQIVKFEGRIVAIKAVELAGEPTPHLLLRLRNDAGAMGTVDAGQRLMFPGGAFDLGAKGEITVTGQLGVLDGHLLLFADQIAFGSQTVVIDRSGGNAPK